MILRGGVTSRSTLNGAQERVRYPGYDREYSEIGFLESHVQNKKDVKC
jgi:hypothetical protein